MVDFPFRIFPSLPTTNCSSSRNFRAVHWPSLLTMTSSYTPEQLSATLDRFDDRFMEGILKGTIVEVMAEISPVLVCAAMIFV